MSSTPFRSMREAIPGLSLRAVARATGINPGRLSAIERGLFPSETERATLLGYLSERIGEMAQAAREQDYDDGLAVNVAGEDVRL